MPLSEFKTFITKLLGPVIIRWFEKSPAMKSESIPSTAYLLPTSTNKFPEEMQASNIDGLYTSIGVIKTDLARGSALIELVVRINID